MTKMYPLYLSLKHVFNKDRLFNDFENMTIALLIGISFK